jgi:hypothetical protein
MRFVNAMCLRYRLMRRNRCTPAGLVWPPRSTARPSGRDRTVARFGSSAHQAVQQFSAGANESCSARMNVLVMHSKLDNGPCKRSGNRNGRRHQLVGLPQSTPLLVVPDRSRWRCWLGVGEATRRGPSASGSYRFILGLVLIAIGHGWAIDRAYVRLTGQHRHHQRRALLASVARMHTVT